MKNAKTKDFMPNNNATSSLNGNEERTGKAIVLITKELKVMEKNSPNSNVLTNDKGDDNDDVSNSERNEGENDVTLPRNDNEEVNKDKGYGTVSVAEDDDGAKKLGKKENLLDNLTLSQNEEEANDKTATTTDISFYSQSCSPSEPSSSKSKDEENDET